MIRPGWKPRRAALIALTALAALTATVGTAAAQTDTGALQANAGGYRNTSGMGPFALPLQGMTFEQDSSPLFDVASTVFGPTDATGAATDPAAPFGTRYVREATAPTGWAPLTTLGRYSSSSPYVGSASVSMGSTPTDPAVAMVDEMSTFVAQAVNPPLPTTCGTGLKVLLLLDTSGSTSGYIDQYTTAAKTFVTTLAGTPTTLRISSFGTNSYPGTETYDLATTTGQAAANAEIERVYGPAYEGGMTNWDAAFQDAALAGVDVIVFVTDGVPTVHQVNGMPMTGYGFEDSAYGVASANLAKYPQLDQALARQRVLGVGVGAGVLVDNLAAVSGPISGTDYTVASNPDDLAAVLKSVAGKICDPTPVTPVTPVVAPPATPAAPVILPPASVRGTSVLYGRSGCTDRRVVTTRIVVRNASTITFIRDGVVVKRVKVASLQRRAYALATRLPAGDYGMHTVLVRVKFTPGATPNSASLVQRFAQCRASAVTG